MNPLQELLYRTPTLAKTYRSQAASITGSLQGCIEAMLSICTLNKLQSIQELHSSVILKNPNDATRTMYLAGIVKQGNKWHLVFQDTVLGFEEEMFTVEQLRFSDLLCLLDTIEQFL